MTVFQPLEIDAIKMLSEMARSVHLPREMFIVFIIISNREPFHPLDPAYSNIHLDNHHQPSINNNNNNNNNDDVGLNDPLWLEFLCKISESIEYCLSHQRFFSASNICENKENKGNNEVEDKIVFLSSFFSVVPSNFEKYILSFLIEAPQRIFFDFVLSIMRKGGGPQSDEASAPSKINYFSDDLPKILLNRLFTIIIHHLRMNDQQFFDSFKSFIPSGIKRGKPPGSTGLFGNNNNSTGPGGGDQGIFGNNAGFAGSAGLFASGGGSGSGIFGNNTAFFHIPAITPDPVSLDKNLYPKYSKGSTQAEVERIIESEEFKLMKINSLLEPETQTLSTFIEPSTLLDTLLSIKALGSVRLSHNEMVLFSLLYLRCERLSRSTMIFSPALLDIIIQNSSTYKDDIKVVLDLYIHDKNDDQNDHKHDDIDQGIPSLSNKLPDSSVLGGLSVFGSSTFSPDFTIPNNHWNQGVLSSEPKALEPLRTKLNSFDPECFINIAHHLSCYEFISIVGPHLDLITDWLITCITLNKEIKRLNLYHYANELHLRHFKELLYASLPALVANLDLYRCRLILIDQSHTCEVNHKETKSTCRLMSIYNQAIPLQPLSLLLYQYTANCNLCRLLDHLFGLPYSYEFIDNSVLADITLKLLNHFSNTGHDESKRARNNDILISMKVSKRSNDSNDKYLLLQLMKLIQNSESHHELEAFTNLILRADNLVMEDPLLKLQVESRIKEIFSSGSSSASPLTLLSAIPLTLLTEILNNVFPLPHQMKKLLKFFTYEVALGDGHTFFHLANAVLPLLSKFIMDYFTSATVNPAYLSNDPSINIVEEIIKLIRFIAFKIYFTKVNSVPPPLELSYQSYLEKSEKRVNLGTPPQDKPYDNDSIVRETFDVIQATKSIIHLISQYTHRLDKWMKLFLDFTSSDLTVTMNFPFANEHSLSIVELSLSGYSPSNQIVKSAEIHETWQFSQFSWSEPMKSTSDTIPITPPIIPVANPFTNPFTSSFAAGGGFTL